MTDVVSALAPAFVYAVVALAALIVLRGLAGSRPRRLTFPYERRPALFTEAEARFLRALRAAVPELEVFGKVRLEDVVQVRRGLSRRDHLAARGHVKSRHLDFVVVDPATTAVLCAVELDDASHARESARRSDAIKDGALAAAGVPLLRVPVRQTYDVAELRRQLREALPQRQDGKWRGRAGGR